MDKKITQEVSFYETSQHIIEEIYDTYRVPEKQFAVYEKSTGIISYTDALELDSGKMLTPIQSPYLIDKGVVLLPSQAEDFISEEKLLAEIRVFIHKYLDIHPFYEKIAAHYVLTTWLFDRLSVVPYLRAVGDYGSGKTRFVQTIGAICYKPMLLAGATSDAYLFRVIELFGGTLVINELERVNTDMQSQITIILNNGYEKGMPVGRVEGDVKREPRTFDVFCPKILSSRQKFKDQALESRIISVPMQPTARTDISPFITDEFGIEAQGLRNKLLSFRFQHMQKFSYTTPQEIPESFSQLEPRLRQTFLPLLYVLKDKQLEKDLIDFAINYQSQMTTDRGSEIQGLVFSKLYELYQKEEKDIAIKEVTDAVNREIDDIKIKYSAHRIGKIIRDDLQLKTRKSTGGRYIIILSNAKEQLQRLIARYGIETPLSPPSPLPATSSEVDIVETVDIPEKKQEKESYLQSLSDEELIKKESETKSALETIEKETKEYATKYSEWFALRQEGEIRNLWGFIPIPDKHLVDYFLQE